MSGSAHQTVLLDQAVDALNVSPSGCYVDATFGRGGHSKKILDKLGKKGSLYVIDCDPEAIKIANELSQSDSRVRVCEGVFAEIKQMLGEQMLGQVDGLLFDFGLSSPQIDQAQRGFSFQQDGPLDMRMDNSQGNSAAQWISGASVDEMKKVFWRYGEEKNSGRIARLIDEHRQDEAIETTLQLAELIRKVNFREKKHPATRVFQAIRIFINKELEQIETVLPMSLDLMRSKARLVVISFHSLEDRIVKRFMRASSRIKQADRRMPILIEEDLPVLKLVGKPVKAVDHEDNVRARSAIMRVAEKR
ncbi:MAG: 16S rRNA (cytosine(1402)-N(4))-methyltransferase RsmH [Proteobacteria bacterium]|nr:16S rRNA (cytosine(1402)-N(4))-methyltransferase RsmH [Pseudomonadota bacterium]